ncbi:MAG: zinc ABC transporter substrate-binding protein [Hyphomicrobiales bacterium]
MKHWSLIFAVAIACLLGSLPARAELKVVASIMPVHSIVAAVMGDLGQPKLLLAGRLSEHAASFTPSQIAHLGKADLVFMVGGGLERKLGQLSGSEAVTGKVFVELAMAPGIKTHAIREGGGWEKDDHENDGLPVDPHVWLDPDNARAMADAAAATLSQADPANAATYAANAKAFAASLAALSAEVEVVLAGVKDKPYIVFHDAYQYFERRFGLNAVGSIADFSAAAPSAQRLRDIRAKIAETGAVCAFREPQFDEKFVTTAIEGSTARSGILDPLGADLEPGAGAYPKLLRNLAQSLASCLAG